MSNEDSSTFRTIDLVKAMSFGWGNHHDLTAGEMQVLQFIALRGKKNEKDVAFAWFPMGGQEWWAAHLGMSADKLKRALRGLRSKNLMVDITGSTVDARFFTIKGYAIPLGVMLDAYEWYKSRQDIRFTRVEITVENLVDNESESFTKVRNPHLQVQNPHFEVRNPHFDTPSDQGFYPTYPVNKPGEQTQLFTQRPSPSGPSSLSEGDPMRYEDEWSVPKDEVGDKRKLPPDDFSVPKEALERRERPTAATSRLADLFHAEWTIARQQRKMLAVPWSSKQAFLARLKDLLKDHSEEEITEMIVVFFRMVLAGQVTLKSTELWKDFWNVRGKVASIARQRVTTIDADSQRELERWRKRVHK